MNPRDRGLVESEEQDENKKMKFVKMNPRDRGLVESEEQDENKKMKSIVVEEQEQEEGSESETGFVDLNKDTLYHVLICLESVDMFALGRAACVNKLWRMAARDNRIWRLISTLHNEEKKRGEQESETGFEDLNEVKRGEQESETGFEGLINIPRNVLKFLHKFRSMRAARVNKPCCDVAESERFEERVVGPSVNGQGPPGYITCRHGLAWSTTYHRVNFPQVAKPPPLDFYSIDPQVFSSQIVPWV